MVIVFPSFRSSYSRSIKIFLMIIVIKYTNNITWVSSVRICISFTIDLLITFGFFFTKGSTTMPSFGPSFWWLLFPWDPRTFNIYLSATPFLLVFLMLPSNGFCATKIGSWAGFRLFDDGIFVVIIQFIISRGTNPASSTLIAILW